MIDFKEYDKTLPKSKEIYFKIFGKPKTHAQWAESFNIIYEINKILRNDR